MKKSLSLLIVTVLVLSVLSGCSLFEPKGETLKVMQFNVQVAEKADTERKASALRSIVDKYSPDIIGFNEVTVAWHNTLEDIVFSDDSYEGVFKSRTSGQEGTPCYYRADKFELVDSGTFWLSETPDKEGSAVSGVNCVRIATWVKLKTIKTGTEFVHISTHLDHNGNNNVYKGREIRRQQAGYLMDFVDTLGDIPVVITGDFNQVRLDDDGNPCPAYEVITEKFDDTRLVAKKTVSENKTASMTKYYDETNSAYEPTHQPIDYVFLSKGDFYAASYDSFMPTVNGVTVSDHLGLFCRVKILVK